MADEQTLAKTVRTISNAVEIPAPKSGAGGTPAPAALTAGMKLRLVALVILKRIRFIAVLAAVGLFIRYWDTVSNYWDKWTHPHNAATSQLEPGQEFYCPMDPQVVRPGYEPNGDVPKCPICGMPLAVRKTGEKVKLPAGVTARVQLSPERIQLAGIKTVAVEYRPMFRETKTVGYVTFDESRLSRVVSRVDGYVEKLYVDKTFDFVRRGDPLAEIYSPDLYSTARELILSAKGQGVDGVATYARNKLLLLGVDRVDIDRMVAAGEPSTQIVIRSPQTGYVVAKKIVAGASVEAKMTLLEVADLSTVWIEADVYEKDIAFLQVGQTIEATVEAYPQRVFKGKLALIYPQLDAATRTNRVRCELENAGNELRPGMFATVRIKAPLQDVEPYKSLAAKSGSDRLSPAGGAVREYLVVPQAAVIDTGAKKVVYVAREPGLFEGVEVELGPRQDDWFPVIRGLKPGDQVAAAGGFLIDAETRLNPAAAATYFGASGGPQFAGGSPPVAAAQSVEKDSQPMPNMTAALSAEQLDNIEKMPEEDRAAAKAQGMCPVTGAALGSMGVPVRISLRGQAVFVCCKSCVGKALRSPEAVLKKLEKGRKP